MLLVKGWIILKKTGHFEGEVRSIRALPLGRNLFQPTSLLVCSFPLLAARGEVLGKQEGHDSKIGRSAELEGTKGQKTQSEVPRSEARLG